MQNKLFFPPFPLAGQENNLSLISQIPIVMIRLSWIVRAAVSSRGFRFVPAVSRLRPSFADAFASSVRVHQARFIFAHVEEINDE